MTVEIISTKVWDIGIYGKKLIFTKNIKIFTCPAAWDTRKYERKSTIFEPCDSDCVYLGVIGYTL